jgi:xanthine dehydrogenase large subunit
MNMSTNRRTSASSNMGPNMNAFHESARLHVLGQATYTDDMAELHGTLHAALGLSSRAHANILAMDLSAVAQAPGVVAVFTARDIPGRNDCGPIIHDDPILAEGKVEYLGQPIFLVVAHSQIEARRAAKLAQITYQDLPAILTPQQARAANSMVLPPLHLKRGKFDAAYAASPQQMQGSFFVGGQEQFYLEGQIAYALPQEGHGLHIHCSTQHPAEMQHVVAHALGWQAHQVQVTCRRMGGGFGGKESQSAIWACSAALAAHKLQRPVKLRADRDDDFMVTGKRHCVYYEYQVGFDQQGVISATKIEMVLRCGYSADLSGPVATRAVCHFDNAYYLSDVDIRALCGKTHTQSNTAFRGFGGPQGAIAIETIIEDIAIRLGQDALDIRRRNFYRPGFYTTPYGQTVFDNVLEPLVAQLEASSDYRARRAAIAAFNRSSPVLKKGLALTPVKFGIAFNLTHLNQAGALVHVYLDGSILVNHGGTEMGQGLHTKVMQVVARELGVTLDRVRISATDTGKIANTSATAASTGADLNGKAAQDAARQIRARLAEYAAARWGGTAEQVQFADNMVSINGGNLSNNLSGNLGGHTMSFAALIEQAYTARVQLWSDGFYATPGLSWDRQTLTGQPFHYFAYGAAVAEVVLDTLTGESKCLRADLLYDAGQSLNPALDLGQVEGGFVQGMGWLTTEQLVWSAEGKLTTHAPSTYKIPAISDCPADFRVALFDNQNAADTIYRSKAAGEPPLLLAFSVFFALRDAVASVGGHRHAPPLQAPATAEALIDALTAVRKAAGAGAGASAAGTDTSAAVAGVDDVNQR